MVRVILATHLKNLADVDGEVRVRVDGDPTQRRLIDALEVAYPTLRNTIRDPATGRRRPLVRFFACGEDISHESPDAPLPQPVTDGVEPFHVIGAIAGG